MSKTRRTPPVAECMGRNAAARKYGVAFRVIDLAVKSGDLPRYQMYDGTYAYWKRDLDRWNKGRGRK